MATLEMIALTTAQEFMQELNPVCARWNERRDQWIFRGQADAGWSLIPAAMRDESWKPWPRWTLLRKHGGSFAHASLSAEQHVLHDFRLAIDRAGLTVPEDTQLERDVNTMGDLPPAYLGLEFDKLFWWPPKRRLSALALAQHYGIPTRLLDWTWSSRIAALFAARDVARALKGIQPHPNLTSDRLAVWALGTGAIRPAEIQKDPHLESELAVVTAPYASNPNLRAQQGIFTVDRNLSVRRSFDEAIEVFAPQAIDNGWCAAKPFVKLTLPHTEAPKLLKLLSWEAVHAGHIFPGYGGAVLMLQEQWLWDGEA